MFFHHFRVTGFDTEVNLPAAGVFQKRQQFRVHMLQAGDTVVGDLELFLLLQFAETGYPLAVEGEQVVVEEDVANAVLPVQHGDMFDDIFRGVEAEATGKDRAVTVRTGIGTAPAGYDAGIGRRRKTEQRQRIAFGKIGQQVVGRKGERVKISYQLTWCRHCSGSIFPVGNAGDILHIPATVLRQLKHGLFAFADYQVVYSRKRIQKRSADRTGMGASDNSYYPGTTLFEQFRYPVPLHKRRSCA